jgi:hypothetical protein
MGYVITDKTEPLPAAEVSSTVTEKLHVIKETAS